MKLEQPCLASKLDELLCHNYVAAVGCQQLRNKPRKRQTRIMLELKT